MKNLVVCTVPGSVLEKLGVKVLRGKREIPSILQSDGVIQVGGPVDPDAQKDLKLELDNLPLSIWWKIEGKHPLSHEVFSKGMIALVLGQIALKLGKSKDYSVTFASRPKDIDSDWHDVLLQGVSKELGKDIKIGVSPIA